MDAKKERENQHTEASYQKIYLMLF